MGMSKIMNADTLQSGAGGNRSPRPVEINPWFIFLLRENNILTPTVDAVQNCKGRRIEHNRFSSGLGIWQQQQPTLKIDVRPFEVKNLAKAGTG